LGLLDDLLEPGPHAGGYGWLGERRRREREHARDRLAHVMACLAQPLNGVQRPLFRQLKHPRQVPGQTRARPVPATAFPPFPSLVIT
jgi:hypothetical protein